MIRNSHANLDFEAAVLERYKNAAQKVEACLCFAVSYDKSLLELSLTRSRRRIMVAAILRDISAPVTWCSISARAAAKPATLSLRLSGPRAK